MDIDTILSDQEDLAGTSSESEDELVEEQREKQVSSSKNKKKKQEEKSIFDDLSKENAEDDNAVSWDFTSVIQSMKKEKTSENKQTTLDDKIRRAVEARRQKQAEEQAAEQEEDDGESSDTSDSENEENDTGKTRPLTAALNQTKLKEQEERIKQQQQRATSFAQLQLSRPLLRATQTLNFASPTPIQAEAIPLILKGRDVLASAVTGSGKTAAYLLPVIERLLLRDKRSAPITRVLIIVPTRELAQQVSSMLEKLCQFCNDITQAVVVGGLSSSQQALDIRARPDIIIATPGRLIDHLRNTLSFDIADLEILILDEADRLLELGFADELREIVKYAPKQRQTMLFSATISSDITKLAELSLDNPAKVATDPLFDVAQRLIQEFVRVRKVPTALSEKAAEAEQILRREALLFSLCTNVAKTRTIIFFQHKRQAHKTCIAFGLLGLRCAELHGNLTQTKRLEALQRFRDAEVDFLFCTDLAARGIDISGVQNVINFELPKDLTTYVHRVGRTARAGRGGRAISLVGEERRATMKELLRSSSSAQFQSRTIASSSATKAYESLKAVHAEVDNILEQERIEREIRLAEMDATKAENIVIHRDEILSRPKKTWFQSEHEKDELKKQARDVFEGKESESESEEDDTPVKSEKKKERLGNRAKRRRIAAKEREERELNRSIREMRKAEKAGENVNKKAKTEDALIPNELKQQVIARAAKRQSRGGNKVDEDGDPILDLEKESKRKARVSYADSGTSNFVEKRSRGVTIDKFKAKSAAVKLRKGGKLGIHKFKSKQKYKRR